jgi:hypothetical protein
MSKRRICTEVIAEMMAEIPVDKHELIEGLRWNYEDASYKAPEETLQWERTTNTLEKHIPSPSEDWEWRVLSIFTTKPIDELKKMFNPPTP